MELQPRQERYEASAAEAETRELAEILVDSLPVLPPNEARTTEISMMQSQPPLIEFESEKNLDTSTVLTNRCDVCSHNLRACIVSIENSISTNDSMLERVRLREVKDRITVCTRESAVLRLVCSHSKATKKQLFNTPIP